MRIDVTQEDIDSADGFSIRNCPLANAIRRYCPFVDYVGDTEAHFGNGMSVRLPQEAIEFRRAVDSQKPVAPFSFDLHLPTE